MLLQFITKQEPLVAYIPCIDFFYFKSSGGLSLKSAIFIGITFYVIPTHSSVGLHQRIYTCDSIKGKHSPKEVRVVLPVVILRIYSLVQVDYNVLRLYTDKYLREIRQFW